MVEAILAHAMRESQFGECEDRTFLPLGIRSLLMIELVLRIRSVSDVLERRRLDDPRFSRSAHEPGKLPRNDASAVVDVLVWQDHRRRKVIARACGIPGD